MATIHAPCCTGARHIRPSARSRAVRVAACSSCPPQEPLPAWSNLLRRAAATSAAVAVALTVQQTAPALAAKPVPLEDTPTVQATLVPASGSKASGTVTIGPSVNARGRTYMKVEVDVSGLTPGVHGVNIHEKGDVSCADGQCTGGSWNPEGLPHNKPDAVKKFGASASHYVGEGCALHPAPSVSICFALTPQARSLPRSTFLATCWRHWERNGGCERQHEDKLRGPGRDHHWSELHCGTFVCHPCRRG
jgi:Cu/Zn superoxide dismutase